MNKTSIATWLVMLVLFVGQAQAAALLGTIEPEEFKFPIKAGIGTYSADGYKLEGAVFFETTLLTVGYINLNIGWTAPFHPAFDEMEWPVLGDVSELFKDEKAMIHYSASFDLKRWAASKGQKWRVLGDPGIYVGAEDHAWGFQFGVLNIEW